MNDEFPSQFGQLKLRPVAAELRARVLGAVAKELDTPHWARGEVKLCWTVAASFLIGLGLHVWQQRAEAAWELRVFGPRSTPREISNVAQIAAEATDAKTGMWIQRRLTVSRSSPKRVTSLENSQVSRFLYDLSETSPPPEL